MHSATHIKRIIYEGKEEGQLAFQMQCVLDPVTKHLCAGALGILPHQEHTEALAIFSVSLSRSSTVSPGLAALGLPPRPGS